MAGTFSATCAGGVSVTGQASGQLVNPTTIPVTVTGSAVLPTLGQCSFSLTGTGALDSTSTTLTIPYTGTTCLGPVNGTETLHKAAPVPAPTPAPTPTPPAPAAGSAPTVPTNAVLFDHPWTGNVELQLRVLLASGLAGANGLNGQAVVDQMNGLGGIYAGGEFQPQHDGPGGYPTYGYPWFYVSYVPIGNGTSYYQIVEFGTPPAGD